MIDEKFFDPQMWGKIGIKTAENKTFGVSGIACVGRKKQASISHRCLSIFVGVDGFEPPTLCL